MPHPPRPDQWESPNLSDVEFETQPPLLKNLEDFPSAYRLHKIIENWKLWGFFTRSLEFGHDTEEETWLPQRFLGSGAFGGVGMWAKKNAKGDILDEIALKEVDFKKNKFASADFWTRDDRRLTEEAVLQTQLNKTNTENVVHLRGFRAYRIDFDPSEKDEDKITKWRYYFEYAPHGELATLVLKYHWWDQHFPEPFLWHVFDSLAQALLHMKNHSHEGLPSGTCMPRETDALVNLDWKIENIFLGYPEHRKTGFTTWGGTKVYDYPIVKVGDFGIAHYMGPGPNRPDHLHNPVDFYHPGTVGCKPPECVHYGSTWPAGEEPNGPYDISSRYRSRIHKFSLRGNSIGNMSNRRAKAQIQHDRDTVRRITTKSDVWNIGRIVFQLMCFNVNHDHDFWNFVTPDVEEYKAWGNQMIENFDKVTFEYFENEKSPYSAALSRLIQRCMPANADDRISIEDLVEETKSNMEYWDARCEEADEGVIDHEPEERITIGPKLFFRGNSINAMPRGLNNFPAFDGGPYWTAKNWARDDPDWEPLLPSFNKVATPVNAASSSTMNQPEIDHRVQYEYDPTQRRFPNDFQRQFVIRNGHLWLDRQWDQYVEWLEKNNIPVPPPLPVETNYAKDRIGYGPLDRPAHTRQEVARTVRNRRVAARAQRRHISEDAAGYKESDFNQFTKGRLLGRARSEPRLVMPQGVRNHYARANRARRHQQRRHDFQQARAAQAAEQDAEHLHALRAARLEAEAQWSPPSPFPQSPPPSERFEPDDEPDSPYANNQPIERHPNVQRLLDAYQARQDARRTRALDGADGGEVVDSNDPSSS